MRCRSMLSMGLLSGAAALGAWLASPDAALTASAPASSTPQPPASAILFEAEVGPAGRHLFIPAVVCGQPVRLHLDTGASRSGFDNRLRPFLTPTGGRIAIDTPEGSVQLDGFQCPAIKLGSLAAASANAIYCADYSPLSQAAGEPFQGTLGMDILKQFVVEVDFDAGRVRFLDRLPPRRSPPIPLSFAACGRPQVDVKCAGVPHHLVIDTGSNATCLEHRFFDALAGQSLVKAGASHTVLTASGQVVSQSGLLRELSLGPSSHQDILCDRDRFDLLGLRYLSRFRVTFDFPANTLYLEPGNRFATPDPRGITGMRPLRTGAGFVVDAVSPGGAASAAGVRAGDELLAIDGESTKDMDVFRMGELLTARPGHVLTLCIRRFGQETELRPVIRDRFAAEQTQAAYRR